MLSPGDAVGDYEVVEYVGAGGMALVYRAKHRILGSTHAVKILKPHLVSSEELRERFLAEGRIQARIKHPNIVEVTGVIVEPGVAGLVMTFLEGPTLSEHLSGDPLSAEQIAAIMLPLLDGVAAVHALGIVHRDLKPDNIKIRPDGQPILFDFGVARLMSEGAADTVGHRQRFKTRAGRRMGTPGYMSPEQVQGDPGVDARTDVFALGCILYELVSGRKAFEGESDFVIMKAIVSGQRHPLSEVAPQAPAALVTCTEQALSAAPDARPSDAAALKATLSEALTAPPPPPEPLPEPKKPEKPAPEAPRKKRRLWPALLVLLLIGGLGGLVCAGGIFRAATQQMVAEATAVEAMEILAHHKTDPAANKDTGLLQDARDKAARAREIAATPETLGAAAIAEVWLQGWQLASFDADAVNAHLHTVDALSQQAAEAGSGEGLLARAIIASTACARLPATDHRREGLCEEAGARFAAAEAVLGQPDEDRAWLRFELWWTAAEHHNLLAAGWWGVGNKASAAREWERTLALCARGSADISAAPVNDVYLARQCLIAAGGAEHHSEYVGWGRWLRGHDEAEGRLSDWSVARIYRAAHPDCRDLARSSQRRRAWVPDASNKPARRCYYAGLMTLSCPEQAAEVLPWLDRGDPLVTGIKRATRTGTGRCYLE